MKSRSLAAAAILCAVLASLAIAGCSDPTAKLPPPTVDNSKSANASASVEATYGTEVEITVPELQQKLQAQGVTAQVLPRKMSGVFLPAKLSLIQIDGGMAQAYVFKSAKEAKGAAASVDSYGFTLGRTPSQYVSVPWAGWPAFFRSGDMIVIFVTEKGPKAHTARDKTIFNALKAVLGPPFIGGQTPPASLAPSGTPAPTATPSVSPTS